MREWAPTSSPWQKLVGVNPTLMQLACPPRSGPSKFLWPSAHKHCSFRRPCSASTMLCCRDTLLLGHSAAGTLCCWDTLLRRHSAPRTLCSWDTLLLGHSAAGTLCSENVGHSPKPTPSHSLSARLSQQAQGRTATLAAATATAASASAPDTAIVSPEPTTLIKNSKQH